ncbi:hypothetical protein EYF80_039719 [Liparis tanakae]|uniref:Uncharacterized protein n=1 Tax=Liparis tanakae TaxID=230148 RepID=A0A4Z2GAY8_9TELE|nr:hypothetical protein EYF80_039719 [Liparis tanakae]
MSSVIDNDSGLSVWIRSRESSSAAPKQTPHSLVFRVYKSRVFNKRAQLLGSCSRAEPRPAGGEDLLALEPTGVKA